METLNVEKANEVCWRIARQTAERMSPVSMDDISQVVWLWIVEHQLEILSWEEDKWIGRLLWHGFRQAYAYARRERAKIYGYEPQDEYFYRVGTLRKILPLYYGEAAEEMEVYLPDRDAAADIERGLTMVDVYTSSLLYQIFIEDDSEAQTAALAASWGVTLPAAQKKVQRALRALQDALGGPDPYYEGAGSRQAVSNARARAQTGRDYDTR